MQGLGASPQLTDASKRGKRCTRALAEKRSDSLTDVEGNGKLTKCCGVARERASRRHPHP